MRRELALAALVGLAACTSHRGSAPESILQEARRLVGLGELRQAETKLAEFERASRSNPSHALA